MIKKLIALGASVGMLFSAYGVGLTQNGGHFAAAPGRSGELVLPEQASNSSVIDLGFAIDPVTGRQVQGLAVFHHRPGHNGGPGGGGGGDTSTCYGFLARNAKWKVVEPWVVNPSNLDGMDETFVFNRLSGDIAKWEAAAGVNILGDGATTSAVLAADLVSPDGFNEVYFADISSPGAIGVTVVWGIFSGPPFGRELVEWDQVYDDVDFDFGDAAANPALMDFESTSTHELGHSVGMDDLYQAECSLETMYGFGSEGQTHARDLNTGDITGIGKLY